MSAATSMEDVLSRLSKSNEAIADEIQALRAIFGEEKVALYSSSSKGWQPGQTLCLTLETTLPSNDDVDLVLILSLPANYPESNPPRLQLSGKYIGQFAIDSDLFGSITRIYMREDLWQPGEVAVFEGVEKARELCDTFVQIHQDELTAIEAANPHTIAEVDADQEDGLAASLADLDIKRVSQTRAELPQGCRIYTSEPIVDRKSVFVGHACSLELPSQVAQIVNYLLNDKKIAKAAHPAMLAYRCKGSGGVMHQDNDDDGETAAGSRLAHLLSILELDNVLVVVTRWYGGIHLGSDRFKHINQAARDALLQGGFIKTPTNGKK